MSSGRETVFAEHSHIACCSSAEEAAEELEDGATQVNNIVNSFRLTATQFDKKSYMTYLKASALPLPLVFPR